MAVIYCWEEMAVIVWKSTHDCYAKTLLVGEDFTSHSIAYYWISKDIVQALGSLTPFVYLFEGARLYMM